MYISQSQQISVTTEIDTEKVVENHFFPTSSMTNKQTKKEHWTLHSVSRTLVHIKSLIIL